MERGEGGNKARYRKVSESVSPCNFATVTTRSSSRILVRTGLTGFTDCGECASGWYTGWRM